MTTYNDPSKFGVQPPTTSALPGGSVYTAAQQNQTDAVAKQVSLTSKSGGKNKRGGAVQLTPMKVPYPQSNGTTNVNDINYNQQVKGMQGSENAKYDTAWKTGGKRSHSRKRSHNHSPRRKRTQKKNRRRPHSSKRRPNTRKHR